MVRELKEQPDCTAERRASASANRFLRSANLMRRIVIGRVRRLKADGQRFASYPIPLNAELCWVGQPGSDTLDLSSALDELEWIAGERARALELRYFLGCTVEETAELLGSSASTVDSAVRFSLAWLNLRLCEVP